MMDKYSGLDRVEVEKSREKHGDNKLKKEKKKGFFARFFDNFSDPIIKVLVIALAIEVIFTFGSCNLFEVFGILAAILISTTVSTVSELGSERAFERMEAENLGGTAKVIREGKTEKIQAEEIVVGDIMLVGAGESVYADGVLLEGTLTVDQSALNGESQDAQKSVSQSSESGLFSPRGLYRGSLVTGGSGVVRVEKVGENTFYGGVATDIQKETRESPLKRRLSGLASDISKLGYIMAAFVGLSYMFNTYVIANGFDGSAIISALRDYRMLITNLLHTLTAAECPFTNISHGIRNHDAL